MATPDTTYGGLGGRPLKTSAGNAIYTSDGSRIVIKGERDFTPETTWTAD